MSIVIPDTLDALLVPINSVRPDPSNVMQHPPSQIDALAASLVAFGFDQPILARRNGLIIAGHGRLLAARQVGMTHVPVVYTDLDGVDATRRMIGDNRLAALAEPHAETLAELLRQLQAEDALGGTGYDDAAVDALLKEVAGATPTGDDPGPQVDKAAELQAKWGTALGQVWALGEHRLVCGDCTDPVVVASVMQGERAALCVTSPPYGVGKDYESGGLDGWRDLVCRALPLIAQTAPCAAINLGDVKVGPNQREIHTYGELVLMATEAGLPLIGTRVWVKGAAWAGQGPYWLTGYRAVDEFEYIGLFGTATHRERTTEDWRYRGVWDIPSVTANKLHSAMFPVELPRRLLELLTDPGNTVYEPFAGSGTTLIACERLGRKCRAVELSPAYVAVTLDRWSTMTGQMPRLLES